MWGDAGGTGVFQRVEGRVESLLDFQAFLCPVIFMARLCLSVTSDIRGKMHGAREAPLAMTAKPTHTPALAANF
jgi:hypothetical protein